MGTDLITDIVLFAALIGGVLAVARVLRIQRTELKGDIGKLRSEIKGELGTLRTELKGDIGTLRTEIKGDIGTLRTEIKGELASVRKEGVEGRTRLEKQIADGRTALRGVEKRLGGRIDAVRDELVETRVTMADRVARIEGRVFGVPLPGTGTDSA